MATLDFSYRREQLYFEILLDVLDARPADVSMAVSSGPCITRAMKHA